MDSKWGRCPHAPAKGTLSLWNPIIKVSVKPFQKACGAEGQRPIINRLTGKQASSQKNLHDFPFRL